LITLTKKFPISPGYAPDDLVSLATILPPGTVWGELYLRQLAAGPLAQMVQAMVVAGLRPQILSGYRSYGEQAGTYAKWQAEQPARADIISARPGSSEHQLGTTIDFGSPELAAWVGPQIQFHAAFANTQEGIWLAEHAHEYGFTLSYPEAGFETTGFVYEPWHYRFVGIETATWLHDNGRFLTEWQLQNDAFPCVP
jgi:D-alanyl-D-alanine carboxypeptidase